MRYLNTLTRETNSHHTAHRLPHSARNASSFRLSRCGTMHICIANH